MTEQHTNPLIGSKSQFGRKATIADLEDGAAMLNVSAAEHNCPWRFAVVPNDAGRMCIRKIAYDAQAFLPKRDVMDRRGERMTHADATELNRRLEYLGAAARYRPDGSRFTLPTRE